MKFAVHPIQDPVLRPYIQYILFNFNDLPERSSTITSYANSNVCLGVVNGKVLLPDRDGKKVFREQTGISSYLSGIYSRPHHFEVSGPLDEICIDFTPLGYYAFFPMPQQTYIFGEDLLSEAFGKSAITAFERIYEEKDFGRRARQVETFFLEHLRHFEHPFLEECLYHIQRSRGNVTIRQMQELLNCSEKRIIRNFKSYFDISPKAYLRIVKFRFALRQLVGQPGKRLTDICHDCNYYDQSHFIKEFRSFTGSSPKQLRNRLQHLDQKVVIGLSG